MITVLLRAGLCALVLVAIRPALAWAESAIGGRLEAAGWRLYSDDRWAPAHFRLLPDGTIEASSDNSTALIWKKVAPADALKRRLAWEWRVDETMTPTDITVKGGDDRPLALHVWFMKPRAELGFFERLRADILEAIVGLPVHGRLLTYYRFM